MFAEKVIDMKKLNGQNWLELTGSIFWIIMGILTLSDYINTPLIMVMLVIFIVFNLSILALRRKAIMRWTIGGVQWTKELMDITSILFLIIWGFDVEKSIYALILVGICVIVYVSDWIERYVKKRKNGN